VAPRTDLDIAANVPFLQTISSEAAVAIWICVDRWDMLPGAHVNTECTAVIQSTIAVLRRVSDTRRPMMPLLSPPCSNELVEAVLRWHSIPDRAQGGTGAKSCFIGSPGQRYFHEHHRVATGDPGDDICFPGGTLERDRGRATGPDPVVRPARLLETSLLGASPILLAVLSAVAQLWIFLRIWLAVLRMVSMTGRVGR
jgi:hypothetical protein